MSSHSARLRLAIAAAALATTPTVRAATITVGPGCSLGQAVLAANADAAVGACAAGSGADTIQIGPGVLTFDAPWDLVTDPLSALPAVVSDIAFVGAGRDVTVLTRVPTAPELRFVTVAASADVSFTGLGFEGGDVSGVGQPGGAIYADWSYGWYGTLTIDGCAFTGNAAGPGGAIYGRLMDALVVRDAVFAGNAGSGGAIAFGESGALTIQRTTFDANTSTGGTAAFYGGAATVLIEDTVWSDNVGSNGAAALDVGATVALDIHRNRFLGNRGGTAVWLRGGAADTPYAIVDSDFEGNVNPQAAAGLSAVVANPLTIRGCTFTDNAGFYQGGAALVGQSSVTHTTRVEGSTFTGNSSVQGGALFTAGSGLTAIDGCTFEHNRARTIPGYGSGRGGALVVGAPTAITGSRFVGNGDEVYRTWIEVTDATVAESGDAGALSVFTATNGGAIAADAVSWSVSASCFVGNGATAITGPASSDARGNWWGAADGPAGAGPGHGDTLADGVAHLPFLASPPAACAGLVADLAPVAVAAALTPSGGADATPGDDYDALAFPFRVDPVVGRLVVPLVAVNDALDEGVESVRVTLLAPPDAEHPAYLLGDPTTALVAITDDGAGCGTACDDGVACTVDACDGHTLTCTHTPDAAACDDQRPCTVDACGTSGCTHTPDAARCDDHNPCTSDTCSAAGACTHADVAGTCDDGNPCTTGTICQAGACVGGTTVPGCTTEVVDLGAPFGEVVLPTPTGDVCWSGVKHVDACAPLGSCDLTVEACFHPNQTVVDVVIAAGLGAWGEVPFRGLWRSGGFCAVADLPDLGGGAVTTTDGTLWACWDGGGQGSLGAHATATSTVDGVSGTALDGTLTVRVAGDETVTVAGCLRGESDATRVFAGLPGTLSTSAVLTVCVDGSAVVHLREWRPFRDDPGVLVTDVEADFVLDALGRWQLRIDRPLDPVVNLCRFLLKAGRVLAERLDATHWAVTRRGIASFDFAGQHVEAEVQGSVSDEQVTLELASSADLDLDLQVGDPDGDQGGLHVRAPRHVGGLLLAGVDVPPLRSLRLVCDVATTTVDVYGSSTLPLCDQSLTATATVHGELGRAGFTVEGSASVTGLWHFPAPLVLPGLPPLPGPLCLGMASGADPRWTVCGATDLDDGLWLDTRARVPLLGRTADVRLAVALTPPTAARARASLDAPLAIIAPTDHVPGVTSLTVGASAVELELAACGSGASALTLATETTLVTTRGNSVTADVTARAGTDGAALRLRTRGRWVEPFGFPRTALEQGADVALVLPPPTGAFSGRLGFEGLAYALLDGDWPAEPSTTPGAEACEDLPATDEDHDGKVNCLDEDCAGDLFCRATQNDVHVAAVGLAAYYDARGGPSIGGVTLPALALRVDVGRSLSWRADVSLPSLASVDLDTGVLDDPRLPPRQGASGGGSGGTAGSDGRLTPRERALLEAARDRLVAAGEDLVAFQAELLVRLKEESTAFLLARLAADEVERVVSGLGLSAALPDGLCLLAPAACSAPPSFSIAPAFLRPEGSSLAFATRDAIFDGRVFAAGAHLILRDTVTGGRLERHGSFGPNGLVLAAYARAEQDTGAELLAVPASAESSYLRVGLGGDPTDRAATFPGDLDHGVRVGPSPALDVARAGTVEATVTRAAWTESSADALLASRASGGRGWVVSLGDAEGTGFARVAFWAFTGGGWGLPAVVRTRLPVVPPGKPTHVAVTWSTITIDGSDALDVAIYVDGQRQPLDQAGYPPVPAEAAGAPLLVGAGLARLDDLRLWRAQRSALRVAGEAALMPPASAASADLVVRLDLDETAPDGQTTPNAAPGGAALPGRFDLGVGTARDADLATLVLRLVTGAAAESSGLDALAGFALTTLFGTVELRVAAHVGADAASASVSAREVPLMEIETLGARLCIRDVAASVDLLGEAAASGQAKVALCRDGGPTVLGAVDVALGCPEGASCPDPPAGFEAAATGTVGPVDINPADAPRLTLSGTISASTARQEATVVGRLAGDGLALDGRITLSAAGLHITTTLDPPPLFGVDLGPSSCELDQAIGGGRFCGTCRSATPSCTVELCADPVGGELSGGAPLCSLLVTPTLPPLPDGSPCVSDGQCQNGHCNMICYSPGSGARDALCQLGIPDQCAADLVCATGLCGGVLCAKCTPRAGAGGPCAASAQCPDGMTCRGLPKACRWPLGSREVGAACTTFSECRTSVCLGGACGCGSDADCPGETCVAGACVALPTPPALPGQPCQSDDGCLLHQCVGGRCGCAASTDCQSTQLYCGDVLTQLPFVTLPAAAIGACLTKRDDGQPCASGAMCRHDRCGGTLAPPTCYGNGSRALGQSCVADDQCATGRCQLDCDWSGGCLLPTAPLSGPPAGCVCDTRCTCDGHADCASDEYCGLLAPGLSRCKTKKGNGEACLEAAECQSGKCQGWNLVKGCVP